MNLKYYLRGLGIGLIVTTIILTVSGNTSASSKSSSAGYIQSTEPTSSSIIAYDRQQTTESTTQAATEPSTEAATENTTKAEQESTTESVKETTTAVQPVTESTTQATTQAATQAETLATVLPVQSNDGGEVTITVKDIYYGTQAADLLYDAGLITDKSDFVQYLITTGYGTRIHEGVYTIQKGASYETICQTICTR